MDEAHSIIAAKMHHGRKSPKRRVQQHWELNHGTMRGWTTMNAIAG
jgi:hypothetical protein